MRRLAGVRSTLAAADVLPTNAQIYCDFWHWRQQLLHIMCDYYTLATFGRVPARVAPESKPKPNRGYNAATLVGLAKRKTLPNTCVCLCLSVCECVFALCVCVSWAQFYLLRCTRQICIVRATAAAQFLFLFSFHFINVENVISSTCNCCVYVPLPIPVPVPDPALSLWGQDAVVYHKKWACGKLRKPHELRIATE